MAEALDSSRTAAALERIKDRTLVKTQSYVDGTWVGAADGATFPVYDPATNAHLTVVANLGHAETLRAIDAANTAWPAWRELTGKERAGLIRRWFDLLIANADDLAALMTAEQGKPLAEAKGEIVYGASFIEWFAEEAKRVSGDVMASTWHDKRMVVLKQPVGVCASITPWNFPLAMITRKVAPAMAAGCTIVIKPAEQTPLSALAMAELAQVKKSLGADGDKLQGVFVTVDPERDTPEILKSYMASFDPSFVALRGTLEQTAAAAKEFKVFYAKVPGKAEGSYTMDHTAGAFILDGQGHVRLVERYGGGAEALASDVKALLAAG